MTFLFDLTVEILFSDQVMVAESYDIARETYLAILMDRAFQGPVIVASPKGGVDIEEVAKNTPEHIHKVKYNILLNHIKIIICI